MSAITSLSQLDPTKTYSYADYLTWKFDEFVELIKGRLMRPMAGSSRLHQVYSLNIAAEIRQYLKGKPCQVYVAPFDVRLNTAGVNGDQEITTVVQPDICVICDRTKLDDRGCVGSPDWIVEILSPGNTARDTKIKFDLYEESGVLEYWIVFPGVKTVAVYVLEGDQYQLAGEFYEPGPIPVRILSGLELEWSEVFAEA
ncbi:Uma2 family endonuclease [Hymenobacter negativus]|uniref:Uma2 family endonuclease n=1 Tax=Hymenobacter negativus TaxID=2795026 RepID=A0ABS3QBQ5_9BACT|nr:Uma2 family endonuclease [Hymenobacter negativus]MBO2008602.1 Uma2 family endonuclease [Hymenobacter negativus]